MVTFSQWDLATKHMTTRAITRTGNVDNNNNANTNDVLDRQLLERKIAIVTDGFLDNVVKRLRNLELNNNKTSSS
jgi:hypothetical protein